MQVPEKKELVALRQKFPVGTRVVLDYMDDTHAPPVGTVGIVRFVDDLGQIGVSWRTGACLSLIPDVDRFHIARDEEVEDDAREYSCIIGSNKVVLVASTEADAKAFAAAKGAADEPAPCRISKGNAVKYNVYNVSAFRNVALTAQASVRHGSSNTEVARWLLKLTLLFSPNSIGIGGYRRELEEMLGSDTGVREAVNKLVRADQDGLIGAAAVVSKAVLRELPCF